MKDQTDPSAVEIVSESVEHDEQSHQKKFTDSHDEINNIESDEDSGFLNESNISLQICDEQTCNNANTEVDSEESAWKLKIPEKMEELDEKETLKFLKSTFEKINSIPKEDQRKWIMERVHETFDGKIPETLMDLLGAQNFEGDSGNSVDVKPEWLDMEKFRRGQKFAMDYQFGIGYANMLSLFTVFSFQDGLKPIIATNGSSTPYTSFKRYLSTASRIQNWMSSDPWTKGTPAYNDIKAVRKIHAIVRRKTEAMIPEELEDKTTIKQPWCPSLDITRRDFQSTCPAPAPGQCPYIIFEKYPNMKLKQLNQGEMSATQFSFTGLIVLYPKFFGIHYATDEDLEAFCHVWRGLGYLLGIEDEFNFCRGTLEDVRLRSKNFLEYWVKPNLRTIAPEWEHMMRCMIAGVEYYFPGSTYETSLLDLGSLMNLHMPRLYNTISYNAWIAHSVVRFVFNHGIKFSGVRVLLNNKMSQAMEKAKNFDDKKHKELQEKSAKTLDAYFMKLQKATTLIQESALA